jgi:hypothetical protein
MLSRRTFVRLVSWVGGGLFVGGAEAVGSTSAEPQSSVEVKSDFDYYVSSVDNASTVNLLGWGGRTEEQRVLLTWRTLYERDNEGFVVQYRRESPDRLSTSWSEHGFVEGHGTTGEPQDYRYVAPDLVPGAHRFRLKQVGPDGSAEYSDPVTVTVGMKTAVRFTPPAPNPAQTRASVSIAVRDRRDVTIALYDVLGRRVRTVYEGTPPPGENRRVQVDVSSVAAGAYFLRLRTGDHVETHRCTVVQ